MLLPYLLTTLFYTIPSTNSLPTNLASYPTPPPYNCGYVLFRRDENVHASLSAHDSCQPFYFNATAKSYQEAIAYHLYGGCECRFFGSVASCQGNVDAPIFTGPTDGDIGKVLDFEDPRPKWYSCGLEGTT